MDNTKIVETSINSDEDDDESMASMIGALGLDPFLPGLKCSSALSLPHHSPSPAVLHHP